MSPNSLIVPIPRDADKAFFAEIYHETSGPRKDIYIGHDQATQLLAFHLHQQLDQLFYFKRGYNNRVYLARCTDGSEYVIRLGGRFWDHTKITNEAGALRLARKALGDTVAVPTFVGTSIEEAKIRTETSDRIVPFDYIIMDRLPGVPLDSIWDSLLLNEKKDIADQVAAIFAALRSIKLDAIGNFIDGTDNQPKIGPMMEGGQGPFASWGAFVAKNIAQEIKTMHDHEMNFVEITAFLPRLEQLIAKIKSGGLEKEFEGESTTAEQPISFLHGDMESRNMLVVGTKIVGLHDFEFAGGFPSEQEWCAGFEWLFARAEDPFDESEQQKLRDISGDEKELLDYFLTVLKDKHGILQYGRGHHEYKVVLYHLQVNIAPWWLRDVPRAQWTENNRSSFKAAVGSLEKALTFLGC
ncbi:hypothetical protein BGZ82_010002 [Podila clonocystis]|nr:hypothetical protein BGZ82_010002 [Podila clonocystis]